MPTTQGKVLPAARTSVYIVCSPQSHVGTTFAARLLLDFFVSVFGSAIGFDTNPSDPSLAVAFPTRTTVVDLTTTRGQMDLFDSLIVNDAVTKVVDLWHVSFPQFFSLAKTTSYFQEARSLGVRVVVLLMVDQKGRFATEFQELMRRWPNLDVVLFEDEALTTLPADDPFPVAQPHDRKLVLPRIDTSLCHLLSQPEFLAERFTHQSASDDMIELQARMRAALSSIFEQFNALVVAGDVGMPVQMLLRRSAKLHL